MKTPVRVGITGEQAFTVELQHAVSFDPAMPPVLSTPWLIWFLEHAAIDALATHLDGAEVSLGTEIEVQHLAPTPVGHRVSCLARVVHTDGASVAFQLEARDSVELIARGFHRRRIVRVSGLARRVLAKAGT